MKTNTIYKVFAVTTLVVAFAIPAFVSANAFTVVGNTDAADASFNTGGNNTDAANGTGGFNVEGNNTDAASSNNVPGGPFNVGGNDTDAANQGPTDNTPPGNTPGTDNDNNDDDNNNRRRSSGRRSVGTVITGNTGSEIVALPNSCPLITSKMLRRGANNNAVEVAKLQAFLRNTEGLNVTVTGTFDAQTEAAVHAFQKKYTSSVLLPWGGTKSSGIVYITTSKKINQIVCASPLNLTQAELNIINAYRANVLNGSGSVTPGSTGTDGEIFGGTQTGGTVAVGNGTTSGTSTSENPNVASPARTSLATRFWNFIVNLFR